MENIEIPNEIYQSEYLLNTCVGNTANIVKKVKKSKDKTLSKDDMISMKENYEITKQAMATTMNLLTPEQKLKMMINNRKNKR